MFDDSGMNGMIPPVDIGSQTVGEGHPPLLLPDIDMFFNADMKRAEYMVSAVRDAGLKTIKAAVLHDADVALDCGALETYLDNQGNPVSTDYRALIEKKIISKDAHRDLFRFIRDCGLELVLSIYDIEGLDLAISCGAVAIKMPSSNVTHQPLIAAAARSGVPLILDTGKSTWSEIARAIDWAEPAREHGLVIEHSPEAPPAPLTRHYLSMIPQIRHRFGLHAGLSDHHHGNEMMLAATALGAVLLEKGLTEDNPEADQDVYHAMRLSDLAPLKTLTTAIHTAIGLDERAFPADMPKPHGRMGLVARTDLDAGAHLDFDTVRFAFPPLGIGTEDWPQVAGRKLAFAVAAGVPVGWNDLESAP